MEENKKSEAKSSGVRPGVVVGRIASLPFKAAFAIGKFTLTTLVHFAGKTQNEYYNMGSKSAEDVVDIAFGKKYGTPEQKIAAQKYVKDMTEEYKKNNE